MTNEEAIRWLDAIKKYYIHGGDEAYDKKRMKAIDKAIKALEVQPCEDCISRQAVDDAIYDYSRSCDVNYEQIMEFIDKLPSVKPQIEPSEDCISRAEAIQELELKKKAHLIQGNTRMVDLCDLCIKAIKTKPCEDAISRSDLLQKIQEAPTHLNETWDELYDSVIDDINSMPSVTPQTVTEFADKCKECGKIQNEFFNFDAPMVKKSDTVSREAVIRLVEQYPNIIGNRCSGLIADIKHLPSVKPKYTDEEIDKAQAVEQAYVDKMVELAVEETMKKWLNSFDTSSATKCFEAVNLLKQRLEGKE